MSPTTEKQMEEKVPSPVQKDLEILGKSAWGYEGDWFPTDPENSIKSLKVLEDMVTDKYWIYSIPEFKFTVLSHYIERGMHNMNWSVRKETLMVMARILSAEVFDPNREDHINFMNEVFSALNVNIVRLDTKDFSDSEKEYILSGIGNFIDNYRDGDIPVEFQTILTSLNWENIEVSR